MSQEKPATILAIDDELEILAVYQEALETEGYRVLTADNGADGLLMARTEQPALILLDVLLPGIGGFELATLLRQDPLTAATPIIIVTAIDSPLRKAQGLDFGADDYLVKPFDLAELLARVTVTLERGHAAPRETETPP